MMAQSASRMQQDLQETNDAGGEEGRARKRLRLSSDQHGPTPESPVQRLSCQLNKLLDGNEKAELDGLSRTAL